MCWQPLSLMHHATINSFRGMELRGHLYCNLYIIRVHVVPKSTHKQGFFFGVKWHPILPYKASQVFSVMFYFRNIQFLASFSLTTLSRISSTKTNPFFRLILAVFDTPFPRFHGPGWNTSGPPGTPLKKKVPNWWGYCYTTSQIVLWLYCQLDIFFKLNYNLLC